MDTDLETRINQLKLELVKLYETQKNFQDQEVMKISMELDRLINQYQKGLPTSNRR